jgi:hypothetical protein
MICLVLIEALLQMPFGASTQMSAADALLDTLHLTLSGLINGGEDSLLCLTLKALRKWTESCKSITISRLVESPSSNSSGSQFLSQLVALLSSQLQQRHWSTARHAEEAIIQAANVLSACLSNTSDFCTQLRRSAISSLLSSIQSPTEFIIAPLRNSEMQGWEDATVALSNLASTLATEEMEDICTCQHAGSLDLIQVLLELQAHPVHNVALPVTEVWLALQDIPTSDRHSDLTVSFLHSVFARHLHVSRVEPSRVHQSSLINHLLIFLHNLTGTTIHATGRSDIKSHCIPTNV